LKTKQNTDSFIAFDLETTGLGEHDKIIEFGAAKFQKDKIIDTFQALANPKMHIPWEVFSLTGISEEEIRTAQPFESLQDEILSFIGKDTLVAHNAPFDCSFLQRQLPALDNAVIDTLRLSRMLLPYATNHKLETLYELFEKDNLQFHRALDDAIATGKVFLHLRSLLSNLPSEPLKSLAIIAQTLHDRTTDLILASAKNLAARTKRKKRISIQDLQTAPVNVIRYSPSNPHSPTEPTEESVISLLSDGAFLSKSLGTFEPRKEQVELSTNVTRSLHHGDILVSEAGTGTGKTFAYLIPATLWSSFHNERILVSTYTKNLEDQIFHRDLRTILSALHIDFTACIIKGRTNYLCQKRWDDMVRIQFHTLGEEEREALLKLVVWQYYTKTGDISENSGFWLHEHYALWMRLSSDIKDCGMHSCPYFQCCYLAAIRRAAQEANIVVLNHALLFTDLQADQKIIGDYERLVIDEAHNLEKAATDFFGISVTSIQLQSILDRLLKRERGLLATIMDVISLYGEDKSGIKKPQMSNAMDAVDAIRDISAELYARISEDFGRVVYKGSMRLKQGEKLTEDIEPYSQALYDRFQTITKLLDSFLGTASEKLSETIEKRLFDDVSQILEEAVECSANLLAILSCARNDHCYWIESSEKSTYMKFMAAPIDVAPMLRMNLFDVLKSAVLVSATVLVEGEFDYFLNKVGLAGYDRVQMVPLGSSFDYSRQAFSLVPLFISDPQQKGFQVDVADIIRKVVLKTRKGTLVLFTSYRLLNGVYDYLIEPLHQNGIPLLAQGRSGSRYTLAREFREIKNSVLLGTYSFWEGFDVPGSSLENLIITKLPFPAPNEPIMEARGEFLASRGLNPFDHLLVPEAIIRLRQGFGRLIRSRKDRGIIIILDTRIIRREYGKRFLLSLPTNVSASYYEEDFFESIEQFWKT
jgi:ATP-dependent DNA helicase DinG